MSARHVAAGWRHISTAPMDGTKIRARDDEGWEATIKYNSTLLEWVTAQGEKFYPMEWKPK